jgi:hypothetical protein
MFFGDVVAIDMALRWSFSGAGAFRTGKRRGAAIGLEGEAEIRFAQDVQELLADWELLRLGRRPAPIAPLQ